MNLDSLLDLIKPLSPKDEYKHDMRDMLKKLSLSEYPRHWNESWYFNFISKPISCITRISFEPQDKHSSILCLLALNDKPVNAYVNQIAIEGLPDAIGDNKCTYTLIDPHKKWHIEYVDRKYELKFDSLARFKPFDYFEGRKVKELAGEYLDLIDTAAQRHYEQACICKGTFKQKKTEETIDFEVLGHRDHSWGVRNWIYIDRWNWISAQFEDQTVNIARIEAKGHLLIGGFISGKSGNKRVENVEIETKTTEDGKTPTSSTFKIIDQDGKTIEVVSSTRRSIHLPQPTKFGVTEVFEQIADFKMGTKKGEGISEYLISTRF
jgi:hypothetical protein